MGQQIVNAISLGAVYTLFALGLSLVWGVANILNMAHGALFVLGALSGYVIGDHLGLPLAGMLPVAIVIGGLAALTIDLIAFTPILRRRSTESARELAVLLASLGAAAIITNVAGVVTDHQSKGVPDSVLKVSVHKLGSLSITNIALITFVATVVAAGATVAFIRWSPHGRALRAVAFDRELAPLFGVNSTLLSRVTMFAAGGLAAMAGLLLAIRLSAFDAYSGDGLMLKAFAIVILGGIGSVGGTVFAAFGLALLETLLSAYGPSSIPPESVAFVIIVVVLLIRPQGLFGVTASERA